jgi:hypothetical protein
MANPSVCHLESFYQRFGNPDESDNRRFGIIYGSPKTVLDKLVAFRDAVGPFDTLLMTGLDWGGPNEAWERQSMHLLAHEVMPKFRQHVLMQAAG